MSDEDKLVELEESVATLTDLLQGILTLVEAQEQAAGAAVGTTIAEARAALNDIGANLDECGAARDAWSAQLADINESFGTQRAELIAEFTTLKGTAASATTAVTQAITSLREITATRLESALNCLQHGLGTASDSLDRSLEAAGSGLTQLHTHASEHRLDGVAGKGLDSIERVTDALNDIEESGVAIAGDVVDAVEGITGQLDDIVNVINTVKPILDAVAAIA